MDPKLFNTREWLEIKEGLINLEHKYTQALITQQSETNTATTRGRVEAIREILGWEEDAAMYSTEAE